MAIRLKNLRAKRRAAPAPAYAPLAGRAMYASNGGLQ